jgi:hypothetical protein
VNEQFEFRGMWWLPEDPAFQVPGILTFDPDDGATLELLGSFKKALEELGTYPRPKLMLGRPSMESPSPCGTAWRPGPGWPCGDDHFCFHADMVLVGAHFEKESDISFDKLWVEYLHWTSGPTPPVSR